MNLILGSFFQNNVYFEKTIAFKVIRDTEKKIEMLLYLYWIYFEKLFCATTNASLSVFT